MSKKVCKRYGGFPFLLREAIFLNFSSGAGGRAGGPALAGSTDEPNNHSPIFASLLLRFVVTHVFHAQCVCDRNFL